MLRNLLNGDATLSNVVLDTDEHDRMSILCIACEIVSVVTMVTHDLCPNRELMLLWSCY